MTSAAARPVFWNEIRVLILAAMAIFVYTITIGILNGTDIVDFDQRRILGHVHGGTLGWLTLSVFAASHRQAQPFNDLSASEMNGANRSKPLDVDGGR